MKTAAIIAEYNPFHKGHAYHIEKTRQETGADYIVAIMSGDFVQRGAPAFMDKYDRARSALLSGCDLVVELPVIYSSSSAEFFASGAVALLTRLGVCDFLSFGSEEGRLDQLSFLADLLVSEPEEYRLLLKEQLKKGLSYPKAREIALSTYCKSKGFCQFSNEFWDCLKQSNNILALEYLKALKKQNSPMTPVTISRKNTSYHDKNLYDGISSATAIRHFFLEQEDLSPLNHCVPESTYAALKKCRANHCFLDVDDLTPYLHSALLPSFPKDMIWDLNQELENRLSRLPWATLTFSEIADQLKSRQITGTRISRGLLHLILNLSESFFMEQYERNPAPYLRVLGFCKESQPLLKAIKANSQIPVITKPAHGKTRIPSLDYPVFEMDLRAGRLYQSMIFQKSGYRLPDPLSRSPLVIEKDSVIIHPFFA